MLEKKRNLLSKKECKVVELAREKYITAIKKRALNPSDFNTNISCLEELAQAVHYYCAVTETHLDKKMLAEDQYRKSSFSFFRNRAKEKVLKELLIIDSFKKQFQELGESLMKEQLKIEPRITHLNYKESHRTTEDKKGNITSQNDDELYTIIFLDNSRINLPNLGPEALDKARVEFNEKMSELAASHSSNVINISSR